METRGHVKLPSDSCGKKRDLKFDEAENNHGTTNYL